MATKMKSKGPAKPAAKTPPKPKVVAKVMTRPATPTPKAPLKASAKPAMVAKEEGAEKEVTGTETTPDTPLPLLDLSDAEVKKMIKLAKKRGYVTHEQINAVLPSEEVTSDQIEDVFAMLNEMGINVVESEEQDTEEEGREEEEEESDGDLVEASNKTPAKAEKAEPGERTDDPVRMYLREMGSVELLSREGEIAIA
jgi:RNA polymerase primary sigma factor